MEPPARPSSEAKPSAAEEPRPLPPWRSRRFRLTLALVLTAVLVGLMIRSQVPHLGAAWHRYSAKQYIAQEKYDEAVRECDRALAWLPSEAPDLYELRAEIQFKRGDLEAALKDYNKLQELNPNYPEVYERRGFVYQLLGQHDKAVEDAKKLKDWLGEDDPKGFNQLAYTRAVANQDLDAALADIERALKLLGREGDEKVAGSTKPDTSKEWSWASYIDTRGFIYYRQGKYQEALVDFDQAIAAITRAGQAELERHSDRAKQALIKKGSDETLGIMYQHRGLVYEKLGDAAKAQADKEKAKDLGYDPKRHGQ
jgi:tetratricopeptide (TPR) repeat protein